MRKTLSVAIITRNEEANLERTLGSVAWADEIVVVDSGSDDRTEEIARSYRSRFLFGRMEGFAAQKNSALEKCTGDWILSLDADEALSDELAKEIWKLLEGNPPFDGYALRRRNLFWGGGCGMADFIRISSSVVSPWAAELRPGRCMRRCIFQRRLGG